VRDRAVALIDAGGDLGLWEETGSTGPRRAALEKLKAQLLGPQKRAPKVRPPQKILSPLEAGHTVAWKLPDGREIFLRVLSVATWRKGSYPIVDIVNAEGRVYQMEDAFGTRVPARYGVLDILAGD